MYSSVCPVAMIVLMYLNQGTTSEDTRDLRCVTLVCMIFKEAETDSHIDRLTDTIVDPRPVLQAAC